MSRFLGVSVVMPVYNGARFVADAVASVRAQGHDALELIAVDDGSSDATPEVLASLAADPANRIEVVRTANRGPAAARNLGLETASGDVIAFLDADDLWAPGWLRLALTRLADRPRLDVVLGLIDNRDYPGFDLVAHRLREVGVPAFGFTLGAWLFRRRVIGLVGGFDPELRYGEDVDLVLRARDASATFVAIEQVALIRRHHDANLIGDGRAAQRGLLHALRRSVERRRAAGQSPEGALPRLSDLVEREAAVV